MRYRLLLKNQMCKNRNFHDLTIYQIREDYSTFIIPLIKPLIKPLLYFSVYDFAFRVLRRGSTTFLEFSIIKIFYVD